MCTNCGRMLVCIVFFNFLPVVSEVRLCVFECLSEADNPFSTHLAQSEMLELIFMGLQDESYEIRETVLALLGQLGDINPAYVMPTLRKVVIQVGSIFPASEFRLYSYIQCAVYCRFSVN